MTLYSFDKKPRWRYASWACQKQAGLRVNTWLTVKKLAQRYCPLPSEIISSGIHVACGSEVIEQRSFKRNS